GDSPVSHNPLHEVYRSPGSDVTCPPHFLQVEPWKTKEAVHLPCGNGRPGFAAGQPSRHSFTGRRQGLWVQTRLDVGLDRHVRSPDLIRETVRETIEQRAGLTCGQSSSRS